MDLQQSVEGLHQNGYTIIRLEMFTNDQVFHTFLKAKLLFIHQDRFLDDSNILEELRDKGLFGAVSALTLSVCFTNGLNKAEAVVQTQ